MAFNNGSAMGFAMYFDILTVLLFSLIWIGIVTFLLLKKKKSLVYLIFFTIFYVYLFKVLDYTLIQFQSPLLLKYFAPDLILNGQTAGKSMNLIPLITLTPQDLKISLLNILLLIPFGLRTAVHYEFSHEEDSCYWRALWYRYRVSAADNGIHRKNYFPDCRHQ